VQQATKWSNYAAGPGHALSRTRLLGVRVCARVRVCTRIRSYGTEWFFLKRSSTGYITYKNYTAQPTS